MILGKSEMLTSMGVNEVSPLFDFCAVMILYMQGVADSLVGVH